MEKESIDKEIKAFYEQQDIVSKERVIEAMRTAYIDLITDNKPNILIYGTLKAQQDTAEKQELANYYSSLFENILTIYNNLYKKKENRVREFDSINLIVTTNLKDAFINSLKSLLNQASNKNKEAKEHIDREATKRNIDLKIDDKDLTIERLVGQKAFVGKAPIKNIFNSLYLEYGQVLADLTILRTIGKALQIELIDQDEIIDYWNCATYHDLSNTIDDILYMLKSSYKDPSEYNKSDLYIDIMTTKAINHKIRILLDTDKDNETYNKIIESITTIVLKQDKSKTEAKGITKKGYDIQPYELYSDIRKDLTIYYWNRIKNEIRAVAESEAKNGK